MDNSDGLDQNPTPEEIVAISDYLVRGEAKSYQTQEMQAAGKRVLGYMAILESADDESPVPGWVHTAVKTANWAMDTLAVKANNNDIGRSI